MMTFGPLGGDLPARLIVEKDKNGTPPTHGYAQVGSTRIDVEPMEP